MSCIVVLVVKCYVSLSANYCERYTFGDKNLFVSEFSKATRLFAVFSWQPSRPGKLTIDTHTPERTGRSAR